MRFIHFVVLTLLPLAAFASILGSVRGIVHDPQHRPVENTMVMLHSKTSDWSASVTTDATGQFIFNGVALGEYTVTVVAPNFNQAEQKAKEQSSLTTPPPLSL